MPGFNPEFGLQVFYALILTVGYIVFVSFGVAFIASTIIVALLALLLFFPRSGCLQLTCLVVLAFYFWIYNLHGSYASPDPWLLRLYENKAGRSSCTSQIGVPLAYNPHGLVYDDETQLDLPHTFCPYRLLRYADNTGDDFTGTSAEQIIDSKYTPCTSACVYASRFKEDYSANKGRGIHAGWFPLKDYRDVQLCPKMTIEVNQYGKIGIGQHLAATCTWTFVHNGMFPAQESYATTKEFFTCVLCPGYFPSIESADPDWLRAFCMWCLFWIVTVTYWTCVSRCVRPGVKKE